MTIFEKINNLDFEISMQSFFQTNPKCAEKLYQKVIDYLLEYKIDKDQIILDLFCGTGTIGQLISKHTTNNIIGVDIVESAIENAKVNAAKNGVTNVEFYAGDMKDVFNDSFIKKHGQPDVIITDPPRDGMHKNVVAKMLEISPKKIVYVSCNSATQARDLALMKEDYMIEKSQAVDMFPQTHHVENVVLLKRRK